MWARLVVCHGRRVANDKIMKPIGQVTEVKTTDHELSFTFTHKRCIKRKRKRCVFCTPERMNSFYQSNH